MWRALGPNLNEKNAARLARTLDSVECILQSIDKDCKVIERKSHRNPKEGRGCLPDCKRLDY